MQQFQTFQFVDANQVAAEHGFDVVHLDPVGRSVLKDQFVIDQVKDPIFFACSSSRNKPAFEVRFLAENLILLITFTSFGALFSLIQNFNMPSFSNICFTHWVKTKFDDILEFSG